MVTQVDIGNAGERLVARALAGDGYRTNVDTRGPGSTDIEALKPDRSLLIQVKTAIYPNSPANLSADELRNIRARATRLGREAWAAGVQLDRNLAPVGNIAWQQL
jgi:Holliday junction resolvase